MAAKRCKAPVRRKKNPNLRPMFSQLLRAMDEPPPWDGENEFSIHNRVLTAVLDRVKRIRSAEAIIRQLARDTYGKDMTPKEYADTAGYDS